MDIKIKLKKLKNNTISETENLYFEEYIAFRNGTSDDVKTLAESLKDHKLLFGVYSYNKLVDMLTVYQTLEEFEGNKTLREHHLNRVIARRGPKFITFYTSATIIPYTLYKGKCTQGTCHLRMYIWWLAMKDYLEYSEENVPPFIPTVLTPIEEVEKKTDSPSEMAKFARSFDDRSHSFDGASDVGVKVFGSKWQNVTHPILKTVFLANVWTSHCKTGEILETDKAKDSLCRVLVDSLSDKYSTEKLDSLVVEGVVFEARFWQGFSETVLEYGDSEKYEAILSYIADVLRGNAKMPEEAIIFLKDYGHTRKPDLYKKYKPSKSYQGNHLKKYQTIGNNVASCILNIVVK
ncbi:MAG: hypothetical protein ACRC6V_12555 [Bacteroidales bacterium]